MGHTEKIICENGREYLLIVNAEIPDIERYDTSQTLPALIECVQFLGDATYKAWAFSLASLLNQYRNSPYQVMEYIRNTEQDLPLAQ